MGKKGSWFSAVKRAFTSNSKDNPNNEYERQHPKEKKKWGLGKSRNGEINSFISLYREPSSIEKILGDQKKEHQHRMHQMPPNREGLPKKDLPPPKKEVPPKREPPIPKKEGPPKQERPPSKKVPPKKELHPPKKEVPPKKELLPSNIEVPPAKEQQPPKKEVPPQKLQHSKTPISKNKVSQNCAQIAANKIQAAYRGYMARKSYRALKRLLRLQAVMRGQSVKCQTVNAMRCVQLFFRVQSQIRMRRLEMTESQNKQHHQVTGKSDKENESSLGRWSSKSDAEALEEWDDSMLTKEELDARMRRKVEAVIKRARALAYAYSHQLLQVTPKSTHTISSDIRSGGYPSWRTWLERQLRSMTVAATPTTPKFGMSTAGASHLRSGSRSTQLHDPVNAATPRASNPTTPLRGRNLVISSSRWSARDDESLTSCSSFATPSYMAPTAAAKAKVHRGPAAVAEESGRLSLALSQSLGWDGTPRDWGAHGAGSARSKHRAAHSIGDSSVDSAVSLPVGFLGRKPFNK